jgi:ankyrin repeat protein
MLSTNNVHPTLSLSMQDLDIIESISLQELLKSILEDDINKVSVLLAQGADVNYTTASSQTPLRLATTNFKGFTGASPDIVEKLLNHGAKLQYKDYRTGLYYNYYTSMYEPGINRKTLKLLRNAMEKQQQQK